MPRLRRNSYQQMFDFDRGRIEAFWDSGYRIAYEMALQYCCSCLSRSHDCLVLPSSISTAITNNNWEGRHLTRIALKDPITSSRTLSQEMKSTAKQKISAQTIRQCFHQHRLSDRWPWFWIPFTIYLRLKHFQWGVRQWTWSQEWPDMLCFQTNLDSIYNIMMVASVFDAIVESLRLNVHSTLPYWPIIWNGVPCGTSLGHLFFALISLLTVTLTFLFC